MPFDEFCFVKRTIKFLESSVDARIIIGNKTAVYISHRLSSCRFCDDIVVLDNGRLVQKGSHDTLVSDQNGKYYELWNAQAKYYTDSGKLT